MKFDSACREGEDATFGEFFTTDDFLLFIHGVSSFVVGEPYPSVGTESDLDKFDDYGGLVNHLEFQHRLISTRNLTA